MTTARRIALAALAVSMLVVAAAAAAPDRAGTARNGEIAFARGGSIYVIDAEGGRARRLVAGENPAWSPDGTALAFDRSTDFPGSLYTSDANGKNVRKLADDAWLPEWSPDGTRIAFSGWQFPFPDECTPTAYFEALWTVASDGSDRELLTPAQVARDHCSDPGGESQPDWSPNGKRMIFVSRVLCGPHQTYCAGSVVAPVAGLTLRGSSSWRALRGFGADWSPNGKLIAWSKAVKHVYQIFASTPSARSKARRLTSAKLDSIEPEWSPDGTKIVFVRACGLRVLDVRTRKVHRLTSGGRPCDMSPAWRLLP